MEIIISIVTVVLDSKHQAQQKAEVEIASDIHFLEEGCLCFHDAPVALTCFGRDE